ncbi:MAG: penicillin-binding protein 2 [Oscillospiraceae bacterium]|nr:penicillin-binding protein 2 [Oscillospiraceae bacterium]
MHAKRLIAAFGVVMFISVIVYGNLFLLCSNTGYAIRAQSQSGYLQQYSLGRGNIFDCNFRQLTNVEPRYIALASPGDDSYTALFSAVSGNKQKELFQAAQAGKPFLIELDYPISISGIWQFEDTQRYLDTPIAQHLIGYLNGDGDGVSGVERLFNEELKGGGTVEQVNFATTASGMLLTNQQPKTVSTQGTGLGVMLTIDSAMQRICEGIGADNIEQGAIVVMETATGRIKAAVSLPSYTPTDVASHIQNNDSALLNQYISGYNVGSVFKPVLAAAALQTTIDTNATYICKGWESINGHIYRCAHGTAHGEVDMQRALEVSCNCYFLNLGLQLGAKDVYDIASLMGFGSTTALGGGYTANSGNLPNPDELTDLGQLASVSFGQGKLLATPIQITAATNVFANEGVYVSPTLIEAQVNGYTKEITKSYYNPQRVQAIPQQDAEIMRKMLVSVVENGLATGAKPSSHGAGGKTGTAQTGRKNANGDELYDAWFTGFYPAENPKYTVTVLMDSTTRSGEEAAYIFAKICNALSYCVEE